MKLLQRDKTFTDSATGEVKFYKDIYVSVELIKGEPIDISLKFSDSTQRKVLSACLDTASCKLIVKNGKDKQGNAKQYYFISVDYSLNGIAMNLNSRLSPEQTYILKLASLQK